MTWLENAILAIVEGLTEFLPVSSTGHMMMTGELMGIPLKDIDTYLISVQFGAILAVVWLYRDRFFRSLDFYWKLLAGFLPAAVIGFLFDDYLEQLLQTPVVVGITLITVGIFLLFMHRILPGGKEEAAEISYKQAFVIGLYQCVAMIPGVSRSAATIAGGLSQKLSRVAATEFSFFLAVPTLAAAGGYKLLKNYEHLTAGQLQDIAIGNVLAFITAVLAVKFFISMVQKRGFGWFGVYRIIVGAAFLAWLYFK